MRRGIIMAVSVVVLLAGGFIVYGFMSGWFGTRQDREPLNPVPDGTATTTRRRIANANATGSSERNETGTGSRIVTGIEDDNEFRQRLSQLSGVS